MGCTVSTFEDLDIFKRVFYASDYLYWSSFCVDNLFNQIFGILLDLIEKTVLHSPSSYVSTRSPLPPLLPLRILPG